MLPFAVGEAVIVVKRDSYPRERQEAADLLEEALFCISASSCVRYQPAIVRVRLLGQESLHQDPLRLFFSTK